ncbi:MAG: DUF3810 domain-containing protein [Clostridia bacterium]|nr:DUF3810 domain-containing protein [Clostridia bacterium]
MNKVKRNTVFLVLGSILWAVTAFSLGLYLVFCFFPEFSDAFNQSIAQFLRHVLAKISSILPFSIGEWLVLSLPVAFAALVFGAIRYVKSSRRLSSYLLRLFSGVCVIFCLFVWTFAPGYRGSGIEKKLELDREPVLEVDLLRSTLYLTDELKDLSYDLVSGQSGATIMPYSFDELNEKLLTAYEDFAKDHDFLSTYYSRVKPVFASKLLSYSHITGIYSFPTGEANVNTDFPDYTLPFTMAHELAHQRGIAREDEANFVAYLVCMNSEDTYIRYSAALSLWEYMMNAMYETNPEYYSMLLRILPETVQKEEAAYAEFFKPYQNSNLATVNDFVNDTYLKSQGAKAGTRSYNLVVDLAVAYFKAENIVAK